MQDSSGSTFDAFNKARLLARRPDGIFLSDYEQGEIGPDLVRAACNVGLEGLVSKRADRPYRGGRSRYWIKVDYCTVFNAGVVPARGIKPRREPCVLGIEGDLVPDCRDLDTLEQAVAGRFKSVTTR